MKHSQEQCKLLWLERVRVHWATWRRRQMGGEGGGGPMGCWCDGCNRASGGQMVGRGTSRAKDLRSYSICWQRGAAILRQLLTTWNSYKQGPAEGAVCRSSGSPSVAVVESFIAATVRSLWSVSVAACQRTSHALFTQERGTLVDSWDLRQLHTYQLFTHTVLNLLKARRLTVLEICACLVWRLEEKHRTD